MITKSKWTYFRADQDKKENCSRILIFPFPLGEKIVYTFIYLHVNILCNWYKIILLLVDATQKRLYMTIITWIIIMQITERNRKIIWMHFLCFFSVLFLATVVYINNNIALYIFLVQVLVAQLLSVKKRLLRNVFVLKVSV